eukprot:CAMPEP_0174372324 /NCGR_PEP_ID=MMETSP0811_2-20130205/103219_1 /TAXON_ID=73025 ORGANISM="Eutreptiella gymnastica-like, Strain CCMP1594" /NCGR_SAMPLE_ID=MMETSP0811_2 /ASSEMBLY_ACC=CAM_ASM_000667 /LENGTH=33 /DNA_ID= /DNA_START= /DNA_END= /DNA_ORIENTATION=
MSMAMLCKCPTVEHEIALEHCDAPFGSGVGLKE